MAKSNSEKSDGLEILSIGKLYTGQWDKKYWSSSRGKDRYPYPIGYNALRTQNGITYKMEIQEGLNGPLFTISSTDGHSCSGQTADIVWESFQRRGYQIKLLRGKRYSSKIDGVEFFGFKNTFVQRLLRELVTNISGMPEQNILSSNSLGNETSEAVKQTENTGSKADPNLLPHMAKPQSAAKRNRKARTNKTKSPANSSLKKPRRQNKSCNVKALNSEQQEYGEHQHPFSANKGSPNSSEALQESETSQTILEREKILVLVEESFDKDDHLKVDSLSSQGGMKHLNPENNLPLEESMKILKDGKPFDRSKVLEEQVIKNQMAEEKDEEPPVTDEIQRINDANLWAPDTLDHPPDDSFNLAADIVKDGVAAVTTASHDSDSHPQSEMDTSCLEVNSERNEAASVGHEIAEGLRIGVHNTQRKTITILVSELDEASMIRQKENINFPVQDYVPASTACSLAEAVVPDSFDNAEVGYTPSQGLAQILQVAEVSKEDQSVRGLQTCRSEIEGPSMNDNSEAKP